MQTPYNYTLKLGRYQTGSTSGMHRLCRTDFMPAILESGHIFTLALMMSIGLMVTRPALALDKSERAFIWNEGHARMAAARTPADYLRTAQTYQKLVDDGVRNGPLFYNLGTALLQAGELEPAIDALQRAEQFLGAQHDIRQNLKIAMARKADNETAPWPWPRLVMFWHFYLPAATRMIVAATAFFIFWMALTLRLQGVRYSWLNVILILAVITVILFGTSVVTAWQQGTMPNVFQLLKAPLTRDF